MGISLEEYFLEKFNSYANLPEGLISLVFHEDSLPENNQGVCVPFKLLSFATDFKEICNCSNSAEWDCCVVLDKKWCISRDKYPAYFTYLLGHEFGHAYICLADIYLHLHCCLIDRFIISASKEKIQYQHELPNEQLFDQFGKYLSFKLHGDKKLETEINLLKKTAHDIEKSRLEMIQNLTPEKELNGLRKSIIDFSKAYKNELIKCWKEDLEIHKSYSLASLIPDCDYETLFEY